MKIRRLWLPDTRISNHQVLQQKGHSPKGLKVAIYCRVSTSHEDHAHSLANQTSYFRDLVDSHLDCDSWAFMLTCVLEKTPLDAQGSRECWKTAILLLSRRRSLIAFKRKSHVEAISKPMVLNAKALTAV